MALTDVVLLFTKRVKALFVCVSTYLCWCENIYIHAYARECGCRIVCSCPHMSTAFHYGRVVVRPCVLATVACFKDVSTYEARHLEHR